MTRLTHLTLSHFRSHRLTKVDANGRSVVIYGANGAGKTNILEAVSMLSPGRGMRRAAVAEMIRRPDALGWKVSADVADHQLESWVEPEGGRKTRIDGKVVPATALGKHLSVVWMTPSMDRLWMEGAEGRRRFLDRMVMSFDSHHGERALAYEKAMRERNRLLKDQVHDPHWYAALESQLAENGAAIEMARDAAVLRLCEALNAADSEFPKAEIELIGPDGGDRLVDPDDLSNALADMRSIDMRAGRTLAGPHRSDLSARFAMKGIEAKSASTGEQKAILISLILANVRALASEGRAPVILLDEVAAHLDESRRAALFDEVERLGAQAWMTGTDCDLFAAASSDVLRMAVKEINGESEVTHED